MMEAAPAQARLHPDTRAGGWPPGRAVHDGLRFPTCAASRISIQMGKSTAKLQYRNVFDVLSPFQRPDGYDDETTMGEMPKESVNHVTAMFGKGASS